MVPMNKTAQAPYCTVMQAFLKLAHSLYKQDPMKLTLSYH